MALTRDGRRTAIATLVAAATLVVGQANAEGLSLGVGASTSSAPGGDGTASAAPPPADDSTASPSPTADTSNPSKSTERDLSLDHATYEFAFVSVAAYQAWSIAGSILSVGAGGGLGPALYRYGKLGDKPAGWDPTLEIAYANAFLRFSPIENIDLDVGPKIGLGSALYDAPDAPVTAFAFGGYADLRVGTDRIKVGPRFEYDRIEYAQTYENGWRLTPLMLRIVH